MLATFDMLDRLDRLDRLDAAVACVAMADREGMLRGADAARIDDRDERAAAGAARCGASKGCLDASDMADSDDSACVPVCAAILDKDARLDSDGAFVDTVGASLGAPSASAGTDGCCCDSALNDVVDAILAADPSFRPDSSGCCCGTERAGWPDSDMVVSACGLPCAAIADSDVVGACWDVGVDCNASDKRLGNSAATSHRHMTHIRIV